MSRSNLLHGNTRVAQTVIWKLTNSQTNDCYWTSSLILTKEEKNFLLTRDKTTFQIRITRHGRRQDGTLKKELSATGEESTGRDTGEEGTGRDTGEESTGRDTGEESTGRATGEESTGRDTGEESTGRDTGEESTGRDTGEESTGRDTGEESTGRDTGPDEFLVVPRSSACSHQ